MALHPQAGISFCSGIGGLDLGLHLGTGGELRTVCYVEGEAYAASVLAARQEEGRLCEAPIWSDVKTFNAAAWRGKADCIIAGYPCQPFSDAGRRRGEADERHLWPYIAEHIRTLSPRYVFCENVPGHLSIGFEGVCADLQAMGYTVKAGIFSAAEVGAPHLRKRLFFLCYRKHELAALAHSLSVLDAGQRRREGQRQDAPLAARDGLNGDVAHADSARCSQGSGAPGAAGQREGGLPQPLRYGAAIPHGELANANGKGLEKRQSIGGHDGPQQPSVKRDGADANVANANGARQSQSEGCFSKQRGWAEHGGSESVAYPTGAGCEASNGNGVREGQGPKPRPSAREGGQARGGDGRAQSGMGRAFNGPASGVERDPWRGDWESGVPRTAGKVPFREHRLRALGNAVVPQTAALAYRTLMHEALAEEA